MLNADYFTEAHEYVAFIDHNPNIEIISIVILNNKLVITWKEETA